MKIIKHKTAKIILIFIFSILIITFIVNLINSGKKEKTILNVKEQILCENDSDLFFYLYEFDRIELFPYALYLGNKFNCPVFYYMYLDILNAYKITKPSEAFYNHSEIDRIIYNSRKVFEDTIKGNNISFDKIFIDSCAMLSESGFFDKQPKIHLDSITNNLLVYCINKDYLGFVKLDMWYYYMMGYLNFKRDVKLAKSLFLENKNLVYKDNQSCYNKESNNKYDFSTPDNSFVINILIEKVKNGDIFYYEMLKMIKKYAKLEHEMLLPALIMANKYHYKKAYWDVYKYLWQTFNYNKKNKISNLSEFDDYTLKIALYHLKLANDYKIVDAENVWSTLHGNISDLSIPK